jgi:hypothetical protein
VGRMRRDSAKPRYWHAGWSGRQVGDLLLPLAKQQNPYAKAMRAGLQQARAQSDDPDLASGRIYDICKLYVTSNREFAHAWAVCMPEPQNLAMLQMLFGVGARAYYEVELLDSFGDRLSVPPEPDPDYAAGSFQVEMARVVAVHRPQMSPAAAQVHMLRMATAPPASVITGPQPGAAGVPTSPHA